MKALVAHSQAPLEREPGEFRQMRDIVRRLCEDEFVRFPTFRRFHQLAAELTPEQRMDLFDRLGPETKRAMYANEHDRLEALRVAEGEIEWPEERAQAVSILPASPGTHKRVGTYSGGDVLREISPRDYVEALTGEPVDRYGRFCCPAHDDTNPSAVAYEEPGRGWYCFTCGAGGSAIDLARFVTGLEPRGADYHRLREWIAQRLLGSAVA